MRFFVLILRSFKNSRLPLQAVAHYFRGVALDCLERRTDAVAAYEAVLKFAELDPKLEKKAKHRARVPL